MISSSNCLAHNLSCKYGEYFSIFQLELKLSLLSASWFSVNSSVTFKWEPNRAAPDFMVKLPCQEVVNKWLYNIFVVIAFLVCLIDDILWKIKHKLSWKIIFLLAMRMDCILVPSNVCNQDLVAIVIWLNVLHFLLPLYCFRYVRTFNDIILLVEFLQRTSLLPSWFHHQLHACCKQKQ